MPQPSSAIWAYPWDILAEDPERSLDRIAAAGLQGVNLAVSYHAAMALLPHNPRQRVRFLEDGAIYFRPDMELYDHLEIWPRQSHLTEMRDPLEVICREAERRGLYVTAWTVCLHNSHLGTAHRDKALRNVYGDALTYALCPAQPEVQGYLQALLEDLGRYALHSVQFESYGYMSFPHDHHHVKIGVDLSPVAAYLLGLCFCPACLQAAQNEDIDHRQLQAVVRRYLDEAIDGERSMPDGPAEEAALELMPDLEPYLRMRRRTVLNLVERLGAASPHALHLLGIEAGTATDVAPHVAGVTELAYGATPDTVAAEAQAARARVAPPLELGLGIEATPRLSPTADNLAAKVRAATAAGADALHFYNYGLMPLSSLDWIGAGLADVGAASR